MAKILLTIATLALAGVRAEPPPPSRGYQTEEQQPQPSNTYGTPAQFDRSLSAASVYGVPSKEHGVPNANSAQFDALSAPTRSGIASTISNQYGASDSSSRALAPSSGSSIFSSATANQYRPNAPAPSGHFTSSNSLSRQYGAPGSSTRFSGTSSQSSQFGASSQFNGVPSTQYDSSASSGKFGSISSQFGTPAPSRIGSSTPQFGASTSAQFGGISSSSIPSTSGSSGSLSTQYDTPAQSNQFGSFSSSSSSRPSSISSQYGAPSPSRFNNQNSQYASGGGYTASRGSYNAQEDALSEPANYQYSYEVQDIESGNQFGLEESRQEDNVRGIYRVLLPDGRLQIVEYQANLEGYKPQVRYEVSGAGGYSRGPQRGQTQGPY